VNLGRGFEAFPFLVSVTSTAFYFLLVGLEFELRALRLRSWRSTTWANLQSILLCLFWRW
jgi:hypothetical protein